METLNPFHLKNNEFEVAQYEVFQNESCDQKEIELFELLSDEVSLKYCSELKIDSKEEIKSFVNGFKIYFEQNFQFTYFILSVKNNKIIGEFLLIPPKTVFKTYNIEGVWFIQYILNSRYCDQGIMTQILKMIFDYLKGKINKVGAICNKNNIASIRILEKFKFKNIKNDLFELEYFELNLNE